MAEQDDTANPTRKRRNQLKHTAQVRAAGAASDSVPSPLSPPQTLEEAIERVRTLLLEVRAMLHCLSEVLQYSDDNDGVMHAEVADAAARWINDSAADLDMVKLRPLIEAIRKRDDESGPWQLWAVSGERTIGCVPRRLRNGCALCRHEKGWLGGRGPLDALNGKGTRPVDPWSAPYLASKYL